MRRSALPFLAESTVAGSVARVIIYRRYTGNLNIGYLEVEVAKRGKGRDGGRGGANQGRAVRSPSGRSVAWGHTGGRGVARSAGRRGSCAVPARRGAALRRRFATWTGGLRPPCSARVTRPLGERTARPGPEGRPTPEGRERRGAGTRAGARGSGLGAGELVQVADQGLDAG